MLVFDCSIRSYGRIIMIRQLLYVQLPFILNCVHIHSMELILTYEYLDSK